MRLVFVRERRFFFISRWYAGSPRTRPGTPSAGLPKGGWGWCEGFQYKARKCSKTMMKHVVYHVKRCAKILLHPPEATGLLSAMARYKRTQKSRFSGSFRPATQPGGPRHAKQPQSSVRSGAGAPLSRVARPAHRACSTDTRGAAPHVSSFRGLPCDARAREAFVVCNHSGILARCAWHSSVLGRKRLCCGRQGGRFVCGAFLLGF